MRGNDVEEADVRHGAVLRNEDEKGNLVNETGNPWAGVEEVAGGTPFAAARQQSDGWIHWRTHGSGRDGVVCRYMGRWMRAIASSLGDLVNGGLEYLCRERGQSALEVWAAMGSSIYKRLNRSWRRQDGEHRAVGQERCVRVIQGPTRIPHRVVVIRT